MLRNCLLVSLFFLTNIALCYSMNVDLFTKLFENPLIKLNRLLTENPQKNIKYEGAFELENDIAVVEFNQSVVIDVMVNDKLPTNKLFRIIHLSNISGGTADLVSNGTKIKVTPEFNSKVPVTFNYTVSDEGKIKKTAKVFVLVNDSRVAF